MVSVFIGQRPGRDGIKAGWHLAKIASVEEGVNDKKTPFFKISWEILNEDRHPQGQFFEDMWYLTSKAIWKVAACLEAIGYKMEAGAMDLDPLRVAKSGLIMRIKIESKQNPGYDTPKLSIPFGGYLMPADEIPPEKVSTSAEAGKDDDDPPPF